MDFSLGDGHWKFYHASVGIGTTQNVSVFLSFFLKHLLCRGKSQGSGADMKDWEVCEMGVHNVKFPSNH